MRSTSWALTKKIINLVYLKIFSIFKNVYKKSVSDEVWTTHHDTELILVYNLLPSVWIFDPKISQEKFFPSRNDFIFVLNWEIRKIKFQISVDAKHVEHDSQAFCTPTREAYYIAIYIEIIFWLILENIINCLLIINSDVPTNTNSLTETAKFYRVIWF